MLCLMCSHDSCHNYCPFKMVQGTQLTGGAPSKAPIYHPHPASPAASPCDSHDAVLFAKKKRACLWLFRKGFPAVVEILDHIVANMAAMPLGSELDINNITLRLALDITGEVSGRAGLCVHMLPHAAGVKAWVCVPLACQLLWCHSIHRSVLCVALLSSACGQSMWNCVGGPGRRGGLRHRLWHHGQLQRRGHRRALLHHPERSGRCWVPYLLGHAVLALHADLYGLFVSP